ncbi:unnamed protein product [Bathycoccus prasinos]
MGVAGTAAAMETAPVALLTNDLSRLADTIYIGRRCVLKIRQNIFFSVTTKLVVLGLTFAGLAGLWQAAVVDAGARWLSFSTACRFCAKRRRMTRDETRFHTKLALNLRKKKGRNRNCWRSGNKYIRTAIP